MTYATMSKSLVHLYRELTLWGFGQKASRKMAVTKFINFICAQLIREKLERRYFLPFTIDERRSILSCKYYFNMRIRQAVTCPELSYFERSSIRESLADLLHHWIFFGPGKTMFMTVRPPVIYGRVYAHRCRLRKVRENRDGPFYPLGH
ncbi:unnamed protein product [Auanema sp. JU1783]|nr:unnamed protein product [Auanema sp. JU1783]